MCNSTIQSGHAALRKGRYSRSQQIYFISVSCVGREPLFQNMVSARAGSRALMRLVIQGHANILSWVLMPNHMHLLLRLDNVQELPSIVGRINSCVARAANRALGRVGKFWQGAYHDHALRFDEPPINFIQYIVNNPIKAGLVQNPRDYPYWNITNWDDVSNPLL